MEINKKSFLDSLVVSVVFINLLFMVFFAAGFVKLSAPSGDVVKSEVEPYSDKVSVTFAEADSFGPPFYVNMWVLSIVNILSIILFAGLVYFVKDYLDKKQ